VTGRRRPPVGLLLDYGGTLVEEVGFDARAGTEALFALASRRPPGITLERVLDRATRVSSDVAARRERWLVETPWSALTRLIYDFVGIEFVEPMAELELAFWQASATTRPMPGAREALADLHRFGLALAVVSNSLFSHDVIRYELGKHGLAEHLAFVMVSAEYAVRKPNVLLFDTAAARLGVEPADVWVVGDRLDTDMAGARAAGMTAVWFRPPPGEPADGVDLTVTSWLELVERVQDARRA
jgi:HAD superfamily hydrolase (TIGR01662 family)